MKNKNMSKERTAHLKKFGFLLAPALFLLMLLLPPPSGLELPGWRVAAVGILMAVLWVTESIPIPATSLLPIVLFPLFGVGSVKDAAAPYANPLIFLFLGGFVIAIAMQRWHLHRRIALSIIAAVGMHPRSIIAGFMIATAILSMWVSNTATTLMMLPIALSVIELTSKSEDRRDNFSVALLLGLAFSASIGGLGTLIGTPPNALLAGFMSETFDVHIGFAQWMLIGVPIVVLGLPLNYIVLTYLVFPLKKSASSERVDFIRDELKQLGRISKAERRVAGIFILVALLWMSRPLLANVLPGLSDAGIAIFGALLTFFIPSGMQKGGFLLDWKSAEKLPWGILLLFGGGLSLAWAISATGLSTWIGEQLGVLQSAPMWLLVFVVLTVIIMLTGFTSNTATAAAFLPIMASVAISIGQNPLMLAVPAGIAASCAFMLPVATPPNAIVYGSGRIAITDMVKAGLLLNLIFALLVTLVSFVLVPAVFEVRPM